MVTREKFKTYEGVFDQRTLRTLFKLSSQGYLDEMKSPVSVGKESNVFTATKKDDFVVVKIYRVNNCDFKKMYHYIVADPRFEGLHNQRRKVIYAWAQREYRNLLIARQAGVNAPMPHIVYDNILIMELIGDKGRAAPRLKDSPPKNPQKFHKETIENMKRLYKAGLVHGDLSEFNILNHSQRPYFIDFSHGTKTEAAHELLERDIKTIQHYFTKLGITCDFEKTFTQLTKP